MLNPIEVKMVGVMYVGYYFGKEVTKKKSLYKATLAIANYIKGQM